MNQTPITTSGELDATGHHYRRRMSEQKLQQWADSSVLKVMQYAVTAIAIPLIGWGLNASLNRLSRIEDAINRSVTQNALIEQRLQALERSNSDQESALKVLTERTMSNTFEIQKIDARSQRPPR